MADSDVDSHGDATPAYAVDTVNGVRACGGAKTPPGDAKAYTGHREAGRFTDVLAMCFEAVENATAVFPLSDAIYMEVAKIRQHRQRRDLRLVMERLSRYLVVTSRVVVAQSEVEGLLDQVVGPNPDPLKTMDYLDWGVTRAFGKVGGLRIKSKVTRRDVTDEVGSQHPDGSTAFDRKVARVEVELNRKVLERPGRGALTSPLASP